MQSSGLVKNYPIVSVLLIFLCMICYVTTLNSLVDLTQRGPQTGNLVGGKIDYFPFGQSFVYYVTLENLKGELISTFPDLTAYLMVTSVILSGSAAFALRSRRKGIDNNVRMMSIWNLILGFVCLVSYIGTMTFVADIQEQVSVALGEVVGYSPFVDVSVTQVFQGYLEGGQVRFIPDVPLWIMLTMVIVTLYSIRKRFAEGMSISLHEPKTL
jgi:hypothetical protein